MSPKQKEDFEEASRRIRKAKETAAVELDLRFFNHLTHIPPELARLTSLQRLNLTEWGQLDGDLSRLTALASLQTLEVSECHWLRGDLSPLAGLTSLKSLNLSGCERLSGDLSPLAGLTSLQSLNLSGCRSLEGELSPLTGLTSLQSLNLILCQFRGDLSPLANLILLQRLELASCVYLNGDLSPLASLSLLQYLDLDRCRKLSGDLFPLAGLTSLQMLDLSQCRWITGDFSPLAGLTSLLKFDLSQCSIRRFAPLKRLLPTLEELYLYDCKPEDLPPEILSGGRLNVLFRVRDHYTSGRQIFVSYAWGDISPNASEEDRQRQEVVERLCWTLDKQHWKVIRDKGALDYGDQISTFMKTLGQARLVIVVLSDKYLHSPYCMTELHALYKNARQEKQEFLNRIIPLVLKDANIGTWRDRAAYAKHWEAEFKAMEQDIPHLGEEDLKLYKG